MGMVHKYMGIVIFIYVRYMKRLAESTLNF